MDDLFDQSDLDEKLVKSVINDNYNQVKKFLKKGANPNTTDNYGITPLNYAAMSEDGEESIDIMEILLRYPVV